MAELRQGERIKERYVLKEFKGSGSFGEVWLAYDEFLEIEVAIKLYISLDARGVEEFKTEYKTAYGLNHPNLLAATYFDVWQQRPFLVMKYCPNGSVGNIAGNTSERKIWQFIHDVAAGLAFLHEQEPEPIIHQDIKPDNILIDEKGRFLITDFGISKRVRSTMRKQSKRGAEAGATAYMGPERFSKDPTPIMASDIWSLGASIYELATGELPFCGMGGGMQMNGAELPRLGSNWSNGLNFVMQSCLTKDPWRRPLAKQIVDYASIVLNEGISHNTVDFVKSAMNRKQSNIKCNIDKEKTESTIDNERIKQNSDMPSSKQQGKLLFLREGRVRKRFSQGINVVAVLLISYVGYNALTKEISSELQPAINVEKNVDIFNGRREQNSEALTGATEIAYSLSDSAAIADSIAAIEAAAIEAAAAVETLVH